MRIEGLSPDQRMICDMLWSLETTEQVQSFRDSLPPDKQLICDQMRDMIIAASLDEDIQSEDDCTLARMVLDVIFKRRSRK